MGQLTNDRLKTSRLHWDRTYLQRLFLREWVSRLLLALKLTDKTTAWSHLLRII